MSHAELRAYMLKIFYPPSNNGHFREAAVTNQSAGVKGYIPNGHLPGWALTKPMWGRKPVPSTIRSRTNYTQKRSSSSKAPQGQHVLAYSRVEALRATAS